MKIDTQILFEIINKSVPGQSKEAARAAKMRSFSIPSRFFNDGAEDRKINCFAALVCQDDSWILCDFARLAQIHIFSKSSPWTATDLAMGSEVLSFYYIISHCILKYVICSGGVTYCGDQTMVLTGTGSSPMLLKAFINGVRTFSSPEGKGRTQSL